MEGNDVILMGKLTTVQLDKINNECGNNFKLDLAYFKATDEIRFITHREFGDIRYEYCIYYERKYKSINKRNNANESLKMTNRFIILIKVSKWKKSETLDVWVNQGIQKIINSPELTYDRKLLKHLQKLSHQLDDEKLKSLTFE